MHPLLSRRAAPSAWVWWGALWQGVALPSFSPGGGPGRTISGQGCCGSLQDPARWAEHVVLWWMRGLTPRSPSPVRARLPASPGSRGRPGLWLCPGGLPGVCPPLPTPCSLFLGGLLPSLLPQCRVPAPPAGPLPPPFLAGLASQLWLCRQHGAWQAPLGSCPGGALRIPLAAAQQPCCVQGVGPQAVLRWRLCLLGRAGAGALWGREWAPGQLGGPSAPLFLALSLAGCWGGQHPHLRCRVQPSSRSLAKAQAGSGVSVPASPRPGLPRGLGICHHS